MARKKAGKNRRFSGRKRRNIRGSREECGSWNSCEEAAAAMFGCYDNGFGYDANDPNQCLDDCAYDPEWNSDVCTSQSSAYCNCQVINDSMWYTPSCHCTFNNVAAVVECCGGSINPWDSEFKKGGRVNTNSNTSFGGRTQNNPKGGSNKR